MPEPLTHELLGRNITRITYRRVKNLGRYETETLEAEAVLNEDDDPSAVLADVKAWVHQQLDIAEREEIPALLS